jgi:hypothetical protein
MLVLKKGGVEQGDELMKGRDGLCRLKHDVTCWQDVDC